MAAIHEAEGDLISAERNYTLALKVDRKPLTTTQRDRKKTEIVLFYSSQLRGVGSAWHNASQCKP